MKKLISLLLTLTVITVSAACSGPTNATATSASANSEPIATTTEANKDAITLNLSLSYTEDSSIGVAARDWANRITEYTDGRYKVDLFYSNILTNGDQQRDIEMFQRGDIDLDIIPSGILGNTEPNIQAIMIPWMWDGFEAVDKTLNMDTKVGKIYKDMLLKKDIVALGFFEAGFRQLTNSKKEIHTAADMKGLKFRTTYSQMIQEAFTAMGANPSGLAFSELFTALQQGAIDGQENPVVAVIVPQKFYEVQKYTTLWNYCYEVVVPCVSTKVWDSLSSEDQDAFQKAATEAVIEQRKNDRAAYNDAIQFLRDQGVTVTEPTAEETQTFRDAISGCYESWYAQYDQELIAALKEANGL